MTKNPDRGRIMWYVLFSAICWLYSRERSRSLACYRRSPDGSQ
ncbi:hypothetical protein [Limnofasciculus baicalensis]|nr:hypothetical protein [Limnofasciculus baicalensis]